MANSQTIPADFPAVANPEEAQEVLVQFGVLSNLTNIQRALLMALVNDAFSEKKRTQRELAADLDIAQSTIIYNLANPRFNTALGLMMVAVTRGKSHVYLTQMEKLADKGDYRAIKFMLEYGGTYTKKLESRNINVNVDGFASAGNVTSLDEAVRSFLVSLGNKGWSIERLIEVWNELKAQQAF